MKRQPLRHRILVADIGGTNARLALAERSKQGWKLSAPQLVAVAPGLDVARLLRHYLLELGRPAIQACAVCAAGPPETLSGGETRIRLTNQRVTLSTSELRAGAGVEHALLLNDFTALALALPLLRRADLRQLGGGRAQRGAALAALGPGTGLGVSALIPHAAGYACAVGEGGHAGLAPQSPVEIALWERMRSDGKPLSAEDVLSGPGLARLHAALAERLRRPARALSAEQITSRARHDKLAARSLEIFSGWLGRFAGDVALHFGARGGVYLGGGMLPALGKAFDTRRFRRGFEDKGRFSAYLKRIPTWLITHPYPALLGLAQAADQ